MIRKRWLTLLVVAGTICVPSLAEENATNNEPPATGTNTETAQVAPPSTEDTGAPGTVTKDESLPEPGNLKKTVNRALLQFKPSEEIDVDRPVDFPTNI